MTTVSAQAKLLSKTEILEKLTIDELRTAIDRCGIAVEDGRVKAVLVKALAARDWEEIRGILPGLSQDRLKKLCRAFDIPDSDRRKADLAARLGQPVLAVYQPWAWAIIAGGKDIENRGWSTKFRGRLYIHACKAKAPAQEVDEMCEKAAEEKGVEPARIRARYEREEALGKVIGSVEIVGVETKLDSRWFSEAEEEDEEEKYGWVLRKPNRLAEPIDLSGGRRIFYRAGLPPLP